MAPLERVDGQRDIGPLVGQPAVELRARELGVALVDRRFDPHPRGVEAHPRLPVVDLAQRKFEGALAAEVLDAHGLDLVRRRRRGDRREGRLLERLDVHGTIEATK